MSSRCSTASAPTSSAGSPLRARRCASTCRTATSGTATSCAASPSGPATWASSCGLSPPRADPRLEARAADRPSWAWDDEGVAEKVAILGAGKMGEALLSGLLRAGRSAADLVFTERHPDRSKLLEERYGVTGVSSATAAETADTLLVAVKPQEMGALLDEIAPVVALRNLVITIAAGIPTAFLEKRLAPDVPVVRVMSNTPVFVDEAMSAIAAGAHAGEEHLERTEALLRPVGKVIRVPESQLDAVTALSGSGPAYFFFLVEAMIDAGILLGLPRAVAAELIVQTAVG